MVAVEMFCASQRRPWLGKVPLFARSTLIESRPIITSCATRRFIRYAHVNEKDIEAARRWLAQFSSKTIPKNICDVSYSRSSGPGGQNVNKVNSKATIKVPLSSLLPLVPVTLHQEIRSSRFFAARSQSLVIQSDDTRKQSQNLQLCFDKLYGLIVEAGKVAVPGETSPEQRQKVKDLQKSAKENRIRAKKAHSSKKTSRQKGFDD